MKPAFLFVLSLVIFFVPSLSFAQSPMKMHLVDAQVENIDSLEQVAVHKKGPSVQYLTLLLNIENSRIRYKPDAFGANFDEIRQLSIQLKNPDGLAIYNYFMAVKAIAFTQDFEKAFIYYNKALESFKGTRDTVGLIKVNMQLSNLNLNANGKVTGSIEQKLVYAREAVRIAQLTKSKELIARSMHAEAVYYFSEKKKDLRKFEDVMLRILKIIDGDSDLIDLKRMYQLDLGEMYLEKGNYQKAVTLFSPALEHESSIASPQNRFILFANASEGYIGLKKYDLARSYALKAMAIARQFNNPEEIQTSYTLLEHLYSETGDFRQALAQAKLNRALADSLAELDKTQQLNDLQIKYQTEKKEQANKLLKQQNQFIQTQNRQYLGAFIMAVAAVILIIVLAIYLKRSNARLMETNKELSQLTSAQKRFFSIIAHDLRTPIINFTGLFDVANHLIKTKQLDRLKTVSDRIDVASLKVDQLLRNLLQYAQFDQRNEWFSPQSTQLKPIIDEVLSIYEVVAVGRDVTCTFSCADELTVVANPDDISLILRNLIDNALKSSKLGGTLQVRAEAVAQQQVKLVVQDNGKGMSPDLLEHLKTVFSRGKSGFLGEQGLGLGMVLVNEAIGRTKGTLTIDSEPDLSTIITMLLPQGVNSSGPALEANPQPLVLDL